MRILFVGEGWRGSSARALRDALTRRSDVELADIDVDRFTPPASGLPARLWSRLAWPLRARILRRAVVGATGAFAPDCILIYKGGPFSARFLTRLKRRGRPVVNILPDCSPQAHGQTLAKAMGAYDLVISTKPFHPAAWRSTYGYANRCVFVAHGYDPAVHLRDAPPERFDFDVAIVASGRPEYHELMRGLAAQPGSHGLKVLICGPGWTRLRSRLPGSWVLTGGGYGDAYGAAIRAARIVLSPVQRHIRAKGQAQPGDEDSTRSYEIPAAFGFMIHRRTPFIASVYDPDTEVPLYDGPEDLARLIHHYLARDDRRRAMAAAAHARAVPAYAVDSRAAEIVTHLTAAIATAREGA